MTSCAYLCAVRAHKVMRLAQIMHRSTGTLCTHTDMETPTAVTSSAIRAAGDLDKLTQDFNSWQEVKTLQTSTAACYNFAPDTVIMQLSSSFTRLLLVC